MGNLKQEGMHSNGQYLECHSMARDEYFTEYKETGRQIHHKKMFALHSSIALNLGQLTGREGNLAF